MDENMEGQVVQEATPAPPIESTAPDGAKPNGGGGA